ncbi:MAG: hypothetical protein KGL35_06455 [Bradyrhizobium sp.]|nr:hypothetical protein [Bradyrhizobium sp.]
MADASALAERDEIRALREYAEHLVAYAASYGDGPLTTEQRVARATYAEVGSILADLVPPVMRLVLDELLPALARVGDTPQETQR